MKSKIKNSIKTGNFFSKLFCLFLITIGFSNYRIQELEVRNKKAKKINRKYKKILDRISYEKDFKDNTDNKIWVCWLQGEKSAPRIVKKSISTIKKYCSDKEITIIDQDNFSNYVKIPDYIINKWKEGIISNAHFSDILRTELLIVYGGTWIDATTILLDKIPDYVYSSDIFMFNMETEDNNLKFNNWFIYSKKNNRILKCQRDLLYEFWKRENKVQDYFIWHIFMTMVYKKYKDDFNEMMYIPNSTAHLLFKNLKNEVPIDYISNVKKIMPIQKVTYKIDNLSKKSLYNRLLDK